MTQDHPDVGWMTFDKAWEEFYSLPQREKRPTDAEKEVAREVCEDLGAISFRIRNDEEIIFSKDHIVHINPGFISTKSRARHVIPADTYNGYSHCYKFTNFKLKEHLQTSAIPKVLCPGWGIWVNPDVECDYCGEVHIIAGHDPQRD